MSLIGNRYVQANDPGTVGVGYQWLDTDTSLLFERNGSNTAWVQVYSTNLTNGGLLPQTGGSVTGAITGTTGWAPSDNANFATAAKIAGQNIATVNYVNQQVTSFNDLISAKISQAIAASTSTANVNAKIGKSGKGVKNNGYFSPSASTQPPGTPTPSEVGVITQKIPLPFYPNGGDEAQEGDCIWMASMALSYTDRVNLTVQVPDQDASNRYWISVFAQTSTNRQYQSVIYTGTAANMTNIQNGFTPMGMNWMILAVNSAQ